MVSINKLSFSKLTALTAWVSVAVIVFVALMIYPSGVPKLGHVTSYWWADTVNSSYVGQQGKAYWTIRSLVLLPQFIILCVYLVLFRKWAANHSGKVLLVLPILFVALPVIGQFAIMGSWETLADHSLRDSWGGAHSYIAIAWSIDNIALYLSDPLSYAGIEGKLLGPLASKAPLYIPAFYCIDQVAIFLLKLFGLNYLDPVFRLAADAIVMQTISAVFIFPMYRFLTISFGEYISLFLVSLMVFSPFAIWAFRDITAWMYLLTWVTGAFGLLLTCQLVNCWSWFKVSILVLMLLIFSLINWQVVLIGIALTSYFVGHKIATSLHASSMQFSSLFTRLLITYIPIIIGAVLMVEVLSRLLLDQSIFSVFVEQFFGGYVALMSGYFDSPAHFIITFFANINEYLLWAGIPAAILIVISIVITTRTLLLTPPTGNTLFIIAVVIIMLLLNLGGISVETQRLWAVFTPFLFVAAGFLLAKLSPNRHSQGTYFTAAIALTFCQSVVHSLTFYSN